MEPGGSGLVVLQEQPLHHRERVPQERVKVDIRYGQPGWLPNSRESEG